MKKIITKSRTLISLLVFVYGISSCDQITPPYKNTSIDTTTNNTVIRAVLLEEFSGVKCKNCPTAHELVDVLYKTYGKRFVPITYQAGFQARPFTGAQDFRTSEGNAFVSEFGLDNGGYPIGILNRTSFNGAFTIYPNSWSSLVNTISAEVPVVKLETTADFNVSNRTFAIRSTVTPLQRVENPIAIVYCILEDSIRTIQELPTGELDSNYTLRHTFRASPRGSYGKQISTGPLERSSSAIVDSLTYTLPATSTAWNVNKLSVVAFITGVQPDKTVLQVVEVKARPTP